MSESLRHTDDYRKAAFSKPHGKTELQVDIGFMMQNDIEPNETKQNTAKAKVLYLLVGLALVPV